jgi:predicted PurR-regulated permease PerM
MSANTTNTAHGKASTEVVPSGHAGRRRLIVALTVLAFLAIGAVALHAISLILTAVMLLLFSALLAYLIYPLVQFLQRRLTRPLAIAVAFLLVASVLAVVMLIVASSINPQLSALARSIQFLLSPAGERRIQSYLDLLGKLGISTEQIAQLKNQLFSQALGALSGLLPFLTGLLSNILDFIIVITLSVYFVLDGARIIRWLSHKTPATSRGTITFLLRTLDQSLGGYFRGTLLLALIGALCTGVVLALLHVPYAALLAVLFFLLYFLPVIGTYVIAALCILAALPQGWVVMLIVALFMALLLGIVMGEILAPRIFSSTVGVHPIVAIFALFAGAELFGLLGGFFAIPVAGVLQQVIVAFWHRWENEHPKQFPPEELPPQQSVVLPEQRVAPIETPTPGVRPDSEFEAAWREVPPGPSFYIRKSFTPLPTLFFTCSA